MTYVLTYADFIAGADAHSHERPTRRLTSLEIENLLEDERRYRAERSESSAAARAPGGINETSAHAPDGSSRAHIRTSRVRRYDFKALPRPANDEIPTTPPTSVGRRLRQYFTDMFTPTRFDDV